MTYTPATIDQLKAVVGTATPTELLNNGWKLAESAADIALGQTVYAYSRGSVRRGIVSKVGRTNITFQYVTKGGIDDTIRYGWGVPSTTEKIAKATTVFVEA